MSKDYIVYKVNPKLTKEKLSELGFYPFGFNENSDVYYINGRLTKEAGMSLQIDLSSFTLMFGVTQPKLQKVWYYAREGSTCLVRDSIKNGLSQIGAPEGLCVNTLGYLDYLVIKEVLIEYKI